jgi:rhodanese-related sulfurtransferase
MARAWRPHIEGPAILALAFACAWTANRAAGPTRRLSWLPRKAPAAAVTAPPEAPAGVPALPEPAAPSPVSVAATPAAKRAPAPAPPPSAPAAPDPGRLLLERFPPLQDRAEADVSGDEARWLHQQGARFLDARRTAAFASGHIPGALGLPVWEDGLDEKVAALDAGTADRNLPVVIYCAGGGCEDSHLLARKLWMLGFKNLRIYAGGFPDWEARGWPVAKGAQP